MLETRERAAHANLTLFSLISRLVARPMRLPSLVVSQVSQVHVSHCFRVPFFSMSIKNRSIQVPSAIIEQSTADDFRAEDFCFILFTLCVSFCYRVPPLIKIISEIHYSIETHELSRVG